MTDHRKFSRQGKKSKVWFANYLAVGGVVGRVKGMAEKMSIDKLDSTKDDSVDDSMDSSPEETAPVPGNNLENQQPKRKGGRKPVCITHGL